jgi:membrane protein DedA with SNARE-associated domain
MEGAVQAAKARLINKGPIAILSSYWMPSIGALTNTAAGIIHLPFKTFIKYSIVSSIFWYSLVGVVVYVVGAGAIKFAAGGTGAMFMYMALLLWMAVLVNKDERLQ